MAFDLAILAGTSPADDLAAACEMVEVCERIGEPTTYRLRYALTEEDGDFPVLADGRLAAGAELTVGTQVADVPEVLAKGQVHGQRIHFIHGVRESWVEVIGGDTCFEMDREVKTKVWDGVSVSDAVTAILSDYGVTPDVDSIATQFSEDTHTLVQRDTDLRLVRRLARRYGHWFWFTTDAEGVTTGHFKRPVTTGSAATTLTINLDDPSLATLDVEWDVERPTAAITQQLGLRDLGTIDGQVARSPLDPVGQAGQAFADVAALRQVVVTAPVDDVGDLQARAEAALIEGGWFVRARGSTSIRALGALLRSHVLVAVDGLGTRHSGGYVVASVRHRIDGTGHVMEFELIRNAWEA